MQPQPKLDQSRELMRDLQQQREMPEHHDPVWAHEYIESSNEIVRREMGFRLLRRVRG